MIVDELLACLPDVGLHLWMLDQPASGIWHAAVYDPKEPIKSHVDGEGTTPAAALMDALTKAGIQIDD